MALHLPKPLLEKQKPRQDRGLLGQYLFCCPHMANDSNFDRNPLRGCNYGLEGGAFLILGGCSSLPKEEERLHEIMC